MDFLRKARVWLLGAIAITASVVAVLRAGDREPATQTVGEAAADAESVQDVHAFFAAVREELGAEAADLQPLGPDARDHAQALLGRGEALLAGHRAELSAEEAAAAEQSLAQLRARLEQPSP